MDHTKTIFSQNYLWPNLRDDICTQIKVCNTCHRNKKQNFRYGKLTSNKAEAIPWDRLLVDLIVPYKIIREGCEKPLIIKALNNYGKTTSEFNIRKNPPSHCEPRTYV